jgi:sulfoxide reductase heme-binding subunit YedZ
VAFAACLIPVTILVWRLFNNDLGANPQETLNREIGNWALRFIVAAIFVRPLADLTRWRWLVAYRRMIGLYAFFYAVLHVTSYLVLDLHLDWAAFFNDILKRNYITVGMVAIVLLIPLAATSTKGMIKRIGGKAWRRLHMAVYVIAPLGVFHFYMMTKADFREPLFHAGLVAIALGYRLWAKLRRHRASRPTARPA